MNRKDICKNIIQSIYEYITNPDKLEPHREKNHFVRKRKLSLYHVIMYLLWPAGMREAYPGYFRAEGWKASGALPAAYRQAARPLPA